VVHRKRCSGGCYAYNFVSTQAVLISADAAHGPAAHQAYCSTAHWAQQVSFSSSIAAASKPMEVEVKIRK
jgi:hypothetical protein